MVNNPLWTAADIVQATNGHCENTEWSANGVAIDNRSVVEGDLFIAIVGPNNDGHDYVAKALESGAVAAIVSRIPEDVADKRKLIVVSDTLHAMEALGRTARKRCSAKVIAVTGSVGKTGTKETLAHILSPQGKTHYSVGSFNNHWGVPLSLSRMPKDTDYAIFELGMNHAGELGPLSKMVEPHVAIITTVAAAHLEFFSSTEDIARAKAEIFEGLKVNGLALLNGDNEHCEMLNALAKKAGINRVAVFGEQQDANIHLDNVELKPNSSEISATIFGQSLSFTLSIPGRHWAQNVLPILGAVSEIDADLQKACISLSTLSAPSGRGAIIKLMHDGKRFTVIDESYNASPVAMQAAFKVLGQMKPEKSGRRIAVLGDMLELGDTSPEIHANLVNDITANSIDMVYAAGPNMRHLSDALPDDLNGGYATGSSELVQPLLAVIRDGDIILIKGSLGSKMKVVLDALKAASDKMSDSDRVGV
ncbi:MAG: UDP-N-acetylmuramoylalanyl-D-glutamyl-2,6-diaminopimelate--D-alanyl-D-alanine ligase [Sneathiella sp.]|nr:UDP-N-acetylmuramoylalanyl-D-glutamyl-2,6-diaminopimelate--D-alanyl-D-alanine ligase [Sneathiella sp.]